MDTDVKLFLEAFKNKLDTILYLEVKARVSFLDALQDAAFFYLAKKQFSIHSYFVPSELVEIFFVFCALILRKTYEIGQKSLKSLPRKSDSN